MTKKKKKNDRRGECMRGLNYMGLQRKTKEKMESNQRVSRTRRRRKRKVLMCQSRGGAGVKRDDRAAGAERKRKPQNQN